MAAETYISSVVHKHLIAQKIASTSSVQSELTVYNYSAALLAFITLLRVYVGPSYFYQLIPSLSLYGLLWSLLVKYGLIN